MTKRYGILTLSIILLFTILAGCVNQKVMRSPGADIEKVEIKDNEKQTNNEKDIDGENKDSNENNDSIKRLTGLFPYKENYHWTYDGSVEYGHNMTLKTIEKNKDSVIYKIEGKVDDMSDGESKNDFSFEAEYIINSNTVIQKKKGNMLMDTFDEMELIRTPLEKETKWTQKVKDKDGNIIELESSIDDVKSEQDKKIYVVTYKDKNSDYYERREIKEGVGVISFEKLYVDPEDKKQNFTMGYGLYYPMTGFSEKVEINKYLPPIDKELGFFGYAEYGHNGKLTKVSADQEKAVYQFNGVYDDGVGTPDKFKIQYSIDYTKGTIMEKVLSNERTKKDELNSKLNELVILKLPFEKGNTWEQEIKIDGKTHKLKATIEEADGQRIKVKYTVPDTKGYYKDTYIETRTFEAGYGLIGFSNLMPGDLDISNEDAKDNEKLEDAIINHSFGYSQYKEQ